MKALYWTGNQSALAASNWIFDQVSLESFSNAAPPLGVVVNERKERENEDEKRNVEGRLEKEAKIS